MHPILFQLGPFTVHTYGFLIAIGFILSVLYIRWIGKKKGIEVNRLIDLAFGCLISGFVGARVLFIITRWEYYQDHLLEIFQVWEGGLVFYGGLILALAFAIWFGKKHKLSFWVVSDMLVPGLVLSHAFGRLGCLAAGCCYGKPTDEPWGIELNSSLVDIAFRGIPLHPTQIYEASSLFIIFIVLVYLNFKKKFDGQVMLTYLITYPIVRSVIEVYRGDIIRGFVIDEVISTSQFISGLVFLGALTALIVKLKKVNHHEINSD